MSFTALLNQLQSQKDDLLLEVESWPSDHIRHRPSLQEWSAIEILDHLVKTEVEILASARRGLLKPRRIGVSDKLRTRFVQAIFRTDRKVKVPSTAALVLPGSNLELPTIVGRWKDSRRQLFDVVNTARETELKKGIFRHPVAGWMGMPEILTFFSVHIIHHHYQLARIRNDIRLQPRP